MKRFYIVELMLSALFLTTSCSDKEDIIEQGVDKQKVQLVFKATPDEGTADTRSYLVSGAVYWNEDDEISVFSPNDATPISNEFVTREGGEKVSFIGTVVNESSTYFGLYPYSATATPNYADASNYKITTTFPDEQTAVDDSFARGANITVASTSALDMEFHFKNVCGLVKFRINSNMASEIRKAVFEGKNNEYLTGSITIEHVGTDTPDYTTPLSGGRTITLNSPSASGFTKNVSYYIVVPPMSFSSGYTITFKKGDDTVVGTLEATGLQAVTRSKILNAGSSVDIDLSKIGADYTASDGEILTGIFGNYRLTIPEGATVTLKNATFYYTGTDAPAIDCGDGATIKLIGTNTVTASGTGKNGIGADSPITLTVSGEGTLKVVGASDAPAIDNTNISALTLTGMTMTDSDDDSSYSSASHPSAKRYVKIEKTAP